MSRTAAIYARVDERVHARVSAIADETGLSISAVTNELLTKVLELEAPAPPTPSEIVTRAMQGGKRAA